MVFAPAEDPQIVVIVIVENSGRGGDVAAPIARELIPFALGPRITIHVMARQID